MKRKGDNLKDPYIRKAKIVNVVDGDTVDAVVDLGFNMAYTMRVRVADIDTPETYRPKSEDERTHGIEASRKDKDLLLGAEVVIKSEKDPGVYGRYTASIQLDDGSDYASVMKALGFEKRGHYITPK